MILISEAHLNLLKVRVWGKQSRSGKKAAERNNCLRLLLHRPRGLEVASGEVFLHTKQNLILHLCPRNVVKTMEQTGLEHQGSGGGLSHRLTEVQAASKEEEQCL